MATVGVKGLRTLRLDLGFSGLLPYPGQLICFSESLEDYMTLRITSLVYITDVIRSVILPFGLLYWCIVYYVPRLGTRWSRRTTPVGGARWRAVVMTSWRAVLMSSDARQPVTSSEVAAAGREWASSVECRRRAPRPPDRPGSCSWDSWCSAGRNCRTVRVPARTRHAINQYNVYVTRCRRICAIDRSRCSVERY